MIAGDATQEQTLRQAQIERARGLIAATTTDATNLYIVLTARSLNPHLKIIARASEDGAEKHLLTAGADSVSRPIPLLVSVSRNRFCARMWSAFSIRRRLISAWIWRSARSTSRPGSMFAGKTLESSRIRQERGVIVLAIKRRDAMRFNPAPDERIEADDYLIAMGEPSQLRQLEQSAAS